ncbi:MAG: DUF92 domain-containing protein [bacterium]
MYGVLKLLPYALAVNLTLGTLAYWRKLVSVSGYIVGLIIGIVIFAYGGVGAYVILCTFFALGLWFSRIGYDEKVALGTHQRSFGRRGGRNALANCVVGFIASLAIGLGVRINPSSIIFASAFATALADTTSNELGQIYGKHPFIPTTFKRVAVGTEGAISIEGTLLGIASAIIIAGEAFIFKMIDWQGFVSVVIGATVGNYIESVISSTPVRKIGGDLLNLTNTIMGAILALLIYRLFF